MKYLQGVRNFFKGKKNINDILNIPTNYGSGYGVYYTNLEGCGEIIPYEGRVDKYISGRHREIFDWALWKEDNPESILLDELGCFNNPNLHLICPKVFFKDLIEICDKNDLEIFFVSFDMRGDKTTVAEFLVRERDFIQGDGLPLDIKNYYFNNIKDEFEKKQKYIIENYTLKIRYISSSIYSVERYDMMNDYKGFMKFSILLGL